VLVKPVLGAFVLDVSVRTDNLCTGSFSQCDVTKFLGNCEHT